MIKILVKRFRASEWGRGLGGWRRERFEKGGIEKSLILLDIRKNKKKIK